jgi:RES domain-containing protein
LIEAWRLCRAVHADLSGEGARLYGGRWNSPGFAVVYLTDHPALAVLEVRVHLDLPLELLPDDYVILLATLPDEPPGEILEIPPDPRASGDAWLASLSSAVLRVPSVLVPGARNLLLNPRHPRAPEAAIRQVSAYRLDLRLWEPR